MLEFQKNNSKTMSLNDVILSLWKKWFQRVTGNWTNNSFGLVLVHIFALLPLVTSATKNEKFFMQVAFIEKCYTGLIQALQELLTLSCQRYLLHRNQFSNFHSKSMDWFLYDRDLRHLRVKNTSKIPRCHGI